MAKMKQPRSSFSKSARKSSAKRSTGTRKGGNRSQAWRGYASGSSFKIPD